MEYYSNSSTYYNNSELPPPPPPSQQQQAKKILPQIPQSRIRPSPSLPQTYPKGQRRVSVDHQRSSSLDHKDEDYEDYEYFQSSGWSKGPSQQSSGDYDDGCGGAVPSYYGADNSRVLQQQEKQSSYARGDSMSATTATLQQRDVVTADEKKDENEGGFNRRDTFMKFYQKTVKHLENPRSFFQQQHTDSAESQDEHKQVTLSDKVSRCFAQKKKGTKKRKEKQ